MTYGIAPQGREQAMALDQGCGSVEKAGRRLDSRRCGPEAWPEARSTAVGGINISYTCIYLHLEDS